MNFTIYFIVAISFIIGIVDTCIIIFQKKTENTVSQVLLRLSKQYPIIPFLFGVLAGHLFWLNT